jgi:hypothetical protein
MTMYHQYTYEDTLAASQRINWRVEDLIGRDKRLDFSKPFIPESLARTERLSFLSGHERRTLNQIRGHGYLYIFGLVEEFILPFVMDHVRERLEGGDARTRAFLAFAAEEAKHIDLFKRFRQEFRTGFPTECAVIGPPAEIARAVLAHDPLAVALVILHIEWMTQRHYVDSIKDDHDLDPQFKSLLRHHWMEEAQHAKLDTLMVEALAAAGSDAALDRAIGEYFDIGGLIDGGLKQQTLFDLESLTAATGRRLSEAERAEFLALQHQAQRWTFLGSGMSHPNFLATLQDLRPAAREQVAKAAAAFS